MNSYTSPSLTISVERNGNRAVMEWIGQSADRSPSQCLTPYLSGIADELMGYDLTVSFNKLEYMNSSTVQPIVHFMKKLDENNISTQIAYNASLSWQRASFKALENLAVMMKHISVSSG